MNNFDVVIYRESSGVALREFKALVLRGRTLEGHSGEDGEPLLDLVIIDPKGGVVPQGSRETEAIRIVHDVAHESHEFTVQDRENAANIGNKLPARYEGGRWSEFTVAVPVAEVAPPAVPSTEPTSPESIQ